MKRFFVLFNILFVFNLTYSQSYLSKVSNILIPNEDNSAITLNGVWKIKVANGIENDLTVFDNDEKNEWREIAVPGCWETFGLCIPKYDYPDSLTGYYKTAFQIPEEWNKNRIYLRFDGVLYGYDLYINKQYVDTWESGYNTRIFDITSYINATSSFQELGMRVYSKYDGSDFDCNDDWAPNGIIRDVTLFTTPNTYLKDISISTEELNEEYADIKIDYVIENQDSDTEVTVTVESPKGEFINVLNSPGVIRVQKPSSWTAETPNLYCAIIKLNTHDTITTYKQKFGIRKISIDGNVFKLNGKPIKLKGVNSHATDPRTIKVIGDTLTLKDMKLMKAASINCIRTSHYPREPRFYELADSLGFYVINEIPFGYGENLLNDENVLPSLKKRAEATIKRDKNHPCVLIWSVGNENELTPVCIEVGKYVKELDPTRPICYPQMGSYFSSQNYTCPDFVDILAPHYPTVDELNTVYQNTDRPILFTEYLHSLGQSFENHHLQWDIIKSTPSMIGGCVWEWVDQGIYFEEKNEKEFYGYETNIYTSENHGITMNGNKGTDGLLYANRIPLPSYYELQRNYANVTIEEKKTNISDINNELKFTVKNNYDFINLDDNHRLSWFLLSYNDTIDKGVIFLDCPPLCEKEYSINLTSSEQVDKSAYLNFDIIYKDGIINQHSIIIENEKNSLTNSLFSNINIPSESPFCMFQEWPLVRVGRKPTLSDKTKANKYLINNYLVHANENKAENDKISVDVELSVSRINNVYKVNFSLEPDKRELIISELGLGMLIDDKIEDIQWIGYGPYSSYPGRNNANTYGLWKLHKDDLYFEGNRIGIDAIILLDKHGDGILLFCDNGMFDFEQTDRGILLTYNTIASGIPPKFQYSYYTQWANAIGKTEGGFYLYNIKKGKVPDIIQKVFDLENVPHSFSPFKTQYDTYLMRFDSIISGTKGVWTTVRSTKNNPNILLNTKYRIDGVRLNSIHSRQVIIDKNKKIIKID